jgi:hypothetical protein
VTHNENKQALGSRGTRYGNRGTDCGLCRGHERAAADDVFRGTGSVPPRASYRPDRRCLRKPPRTGTRPLISIRSSWSGTIEPARCSSTLTTRTGTGTDMRSRPTPRCRHACCASCASRASCNVRSVACFSPNRITNDPQGGEIASSDKHDGNDHGVDGWHSRAERIERES